MIAMTVDSTRRLRRAAYAIAGTLMVASFSAHVVMVYFYAQDRACKHEVFRGGSGYQPSDLSPEEYADNLARTIEAMRDAGISPDRQYFDVPPDWSPPEGWQAPEGWEAPEWWPLTPPAAGP